MNKKDICKNLIKIANHLDSSGYYSEANEITKLSKKIITSANNFFGDLGSNLLGEVKSDLINKNVPSLLADPVNKALSNSTPKSILQPDNQQNDPKQSIIKKQIELLNKMYAEFGTNQKGFYERYPKLGNLSTMDQIYRKAYDLGLNDRFNKDLYKSFAKAIYEKYYVPDYQLRRQLRSLG